MTQSRTQSAIETAVSTAVGFGVSMLVQAVVFPLYGFHATTSQNAQITAIFTVASLARAYVLRRFFNQLHSRKP